MGAGCILNAKYMVSTMVKIENEKIENEKFLKSGILIIYTRTHTREKSKKWLETDDFV